MDWEKIVVPVAGVLALALQLLREGVGRGGRRAKVKRDLEILNLLPDSSKARSELQTHVDNVIRGMIRDETEKRRDAYAAILGIMFLGLAYWAAGLGAKFWSPWLALASTLALLGVVALYQGLVPHKRDERGRIIREERPSRK